MAEHGGLSRGGYEQGSGRRRRSSGESEEPQQRGNRVLSSEWGVRQDERRESSQRSRAFPYLPPATRSSSNLVKEGSGTFFAGLAGTLPRQASSLQRIASVLPTSYLPSEASADPPEDGIPPVNMVRHGSVPVTRKTRLGGAMAHGSKSSKDVNFNNSHNAFQEKINTSTCQMCGDSLSSPEEHMTCDCSFQLCSTCYVHVKKYERSRCPGCTAELRDKEQWLLVEALGAESPTSSSTAHGATQPKTSTDQSSPQNVPDSSSNIEDLTAKAGYGYGSVAWDHPPSKSPERTVPSADLRRRSLSRKIGYPGSQIGPYRILVLIRLCSMIGFLLFRVTTPTEDGYWLWLMSVICEIWFAVSWVLDTIPKLSPVQRETFRDRLRAIYDENGVLLPQLDVFITTADATKEPPLSTCNTILSVLAADYPPERLACYLSDDGSSKLMFDCLAEAAGFARLWVPFCKSHNIEPRAPEAYFTLTIDFLKDKVHPDFVKTRRRVKREYEEFKVRINALVAGSRHMPVEGWKLDDETPWPGNNRRDHDGIVQVFLHPDSDVKDVDGNVLPPLVYVSREKRPGYDHNKKAGAMNALLRASGLITNGPFLMNLDCDHYVNNSSSLREALCYFLDPIHGHTTGYVQFPQRFDGIDKSDRYANKNTVFFDINMKGLDGQQGPVYVGTGCFFRRKALYGYYPSITGPTLSCPRKTSSFWSSLCCCFARRKASASSRRQSEAESGALMPFPQCTFNMGTCDNFVAAATNKENLGLEPEGYSEPSSPRTMLNDVVHAISCDYEANTDWGQDIGWMYGSVTEDILTGMKVHSRGWFSAYADPDKAAFKGSAPLNMTDRLHQVERWATGAVEIFFSRRNPLWSECGTSLMLRQRIAYANNAFYPFTSVAIFTYCLLPPLALFTDFFFVPTLDQYAVLWFAALILSFLATSVLELRWSQVSFEAWWRNEQFWLISGISAHLAAVLQGLLKVIAGFEISFTLTSKGTDDENSDELHTFKYSWLLIPGCFIGLFNILGLIVGFARAIGSSSSQSWGRLGGKLVFSFWVLVHLYPFAKGLLGKRERLPTIILVWSVLLVVTVALLWSNFAGGSTIF